MSGFRRAGAPRVIGLLLGLQAAIGLAVVLEAGGFGNPATWFGPRLPALDPGAPVAPGDHTRRYRPGDLPGAPPGMRPHDLPQTGPMPDRLETRLSETGGRQVLSLAGSIDSGALDRVVRALESGSVEAVLLHSPGGLVDQALAIGREIRARGLDTELPDGAVCLSACPYMLAGGVERRVAAGARVGVHQSYYDRSVYLPLFVGVASVQQGEAEAMRFLEEMGVDPRLRIPALETPADAIYLLTPEELSDYRLATEVTGDAEAS